MRFIKGNSKVINIKIKDENFKWVTEYIYFETKTKEILSSTLSCISSAKSDSDPSKSESLCYQDAYKSFSSLKDELR